MALTGAEKKTVAVVGATLAVAIAANVGGAFLTKKPVPVPVPIIADGGKCPEPRQMVCPDESCALPGMCF